MNTSKGFMEEPLRMVQREYVTPQGDEEKKTIAVSLWAVYTYELAFLTAQENKVEIPDGFPYWETTLSITLYMGFDYESIFQSTPEPLKYLRATTPMLSFVWEDEPEKYLSIGVFDEDVIQFFNTMGFPLGCMLTRPSHEPIVVKYSTIVEAYQKALSER